MRYRCYWLVFVLLLFGVTSCGGGKSGVETFSVISTEPVDNAANVNVSSSMKMTFSLPISVANIDESQIVLRNANELVIDIDVQVEDQTLILIPSHELVNSTFYTVEISAKLLLDGSHQLSRTYVFSFQTDVFDDQKPPILLSSIPAAGDTDVAVNSSVLINFDESLKESSVIGAELYQYDSNAHVLGDRVRINSSPNGKALTLTPIDELLPNMEYLVKLTSISDEAGNVLPSQSWRFITGFQFDTTKPEIFTVIPRDLSSNIPITRKVQIVFSEEIDLSTLSNRQFTVKSLLEDRQLVGKITYQNKTATFQPLENNGVFERGVDYLVEIKNVRDLAGNLIMPYQWQFSTNDATQDAPEVISVTWNLTNNSGVASDAVITVTFSEAVTVERGAVSLSHGVAGDFVMQDHRTLVFVPATLLTEKTQYELMIKAALVIDEDLAPMRLNYSEFFMVGDVTSPLVETHNHFPSVSAENVALNADISITFNEPLDSSNMDEYMSVTQNGLLVIGGMSLTANELRFDPIKDFDQNALIHVTISESVKDLAGNLLGEAYSWSFKSGDTSAPEVLSISPVNLERHISVSRDVVISFAQDETIDPSSVNDLTVSLWNLGELQRVFANYTVNGHQIILSPTEDLLEKTQYYLSVGRGVTDISGRRISSPFVSVFTTEDRTQPVVEAKLFSHHIESDAIGVNQAPQIVFSEAMSLATFTTLSFYLEDSVGQKVKSRFDFDSSMMQSNKVRLIPDFPLREKETYTLHLTRELQDAYGNALVPIRWSFTIGDFTKPVVDFNTPVNNAFNVKQNQVLNIGFNEKMDKTSVETGFSISPSIQGSFLWVGKSLAFFPANFYDEKQRYVVSISQSATDESGNSLDKSYSWSFVIGDYAPPNIVSVSPDINGTVNSDAVEALVTLRFDEPVNSSEFSASATGLVLTLAGKQLKTATNYTSENSVTYSVADGWVANALYHVKYIQYLTDLSENQQLVDVQWDFTSDSLLQGPSPLSGIGSVFLAQGIDNAVEHYYVITGFDATKQYVVNLKGGDVNVDLNLSLYTEVFSMATRTCHSDYSELEMSKSDEVCLGKPNVDGEIYVKVTNNSGFASRFDLHVSTITQLKNAVSANTYDYLTFDSLDVHTEYTVKLSGFAEDLDLYVFEGESILTPVCRSAVMSLNQAESCVFTATSTAVNMLIDGTGTSSDSVSYSITVTTN